MDTLALTYRPRTFDDLVGQRVVQVILRQMIVKNRVPAALLFDGSHGTGKTTSLRILAAALACDTPPDPCGHCAGCTSVYAGTSGQLIEIDAASSGGVEDIRALKQNLRHATAAGHRIIGIDEAQSMSGPAFNALLKLLEEPPPHTSIVLLTTEARKIPDTIIGRCMRFRFQPLTRADIDHRLAQICAAEGINAEALLLTLIAEHAHGSLRDAVMLLDQVTRVGITTVEQYTELMGEPDPGPALFSAIRTGEPGAAYMTLADQLTRTGDPSTITTALTGVLRDICLIHSRADPPAQGEALAARRRLAATLTTREALAALKVLWDHATRIRPGEDKRTAVELAVAALTDVFTPRPTGATGAGASSTPTRTVSFADMAARTR